MTDHESTLTHCLNGPVLLIGGTGILGRAWRQLMDKYSIEYDAPSRDELDLSRRSALKNYLRRQYSLVVNCAGWTDVDGAEEQMATAQRINGTAVGQLARLCAAFETKLVHYSTDYVFSGVRSQPYRVWDGPAPINAYGHSKWIGEHLLGRSRCEFLLIRTSWLYAPWGHNFVRTIAQKAQRCDTLKIVNDQLSRPTSAEHLARVSMALAERGARSTYHVTDGGECTWFDFARQIVRHVNPDCRVEPCTSDQFPRPTKRPSYTVLDLTQTELFLEPMPHWTYNLADVLERLEPVTTDKNQATEPIPT